MSVHSLLAASGLRVSEALHLGRRDVDLRQGLLTVRERKFHRSRYVPLHSTTVAELRHYAARRDAICPIERCPAFFIRDDGTALSYDHARQAFRRLRGSLRWPRDAQGRWPRIHDFRHRFVCARLLAWYQDGADVDVEILKLSRYLGHVSPSSTYWYITGIPALMAVATERFEKFARKGEPS
jgi:integrase